MEDNWWENLVEFEGEEFAVKGSVNSWSVSGNLAALLRLRPVKRITLPVVINLLFSGFSGYGNELLELAEEQFEPWFGHIDHRVPHLIVPVGEEQTTTMPNPTKDSKIFYGFHLNLVKLSPMFNTITQDQILWNLRPEVPVFRANSTGITGDEVLIDFEENDDAEDQKTYYVDADHISSFLQAAAEGLGLEDSYNLFVLNPSSSVKPLENYGYRSGFSQTEIDELQDVWAEGMEDEASLYELLDVEEFPCEDEPPPLPHFLIPDSKANRVQVVDYVEKSTEWANWFLNQQKLAQQASLLSNNRDDPSLLFSFARGESKTVIELAEKIITEGNEFEKDYLFKILLSDEGIQENCLVDVWVSSGRTFFMDLTAGPFQWGPLITTDGARTYHSIPRVPKHDTVDQSIDDHDHKEIADMILTKLKSARQLYIMRCTEEDSKENAKLCKEIENDLDSWSKRYQNLKNSISNEEEIEGSEEEGEDADWVVDDFLSQLSATISQSIRQIVVPGSPLYSTPYTKQIVYDFYLISSHSSYNPRGSDAFDYELFKHEISKLKFASQEVKFSFHQLNMRDSVELATAFYNAKRSTVMPTLSTDGMYSNTEVHFIDSVYLRDSLKKIREINIQEYDAFSQSRRIPILFFSLDYRHPILVDKYYSAKGLSDMVLIVQNSQDQYPSRLSCNNKPIYINLRNPIKHALAATSLVVGGIVPSHVTYNEAHQSASAEWLWSVGDHPWSHTSHGTEFNRIQIDTARRNMIIHSLISTMETVNSCVEILSKIRVDASNEEMAHLLPLNNISITFSQIIRFWKSACSKIASLDFEGALGHIKAADRKADELFIYVMETEAFMKAYQCLPHVVVDSDPESQVILLIPVLFVCFDILLFIMIFLCRNNKKSAKAKIN